MTITVKLWWLQSSNRKEFAIENYRKLIGYRSSVILDWRHNSRFPHISIMQSWTNGDLFQKHPENPGYNAVKNILDRNTQLSATNLF